MILFGTDPPPGNGHFTGWPAGGTQSNQARSDAVRWRRGVRYLRRHPRPVSYTHLIVDKDGKETISLATPKHVKVMLTESSNETGGPTLSLHSDGDIVITAGGRIHLQSAFYSREVG